MIKVILILKTVAVIQLLCRVFIVLYCLHVGLVNTRYNQFILVENNELVACVLVSY